VKTALVVHGEWGPPSLLGQWAAARGLPLQIHRADHGEPQPELGWHTIRSADPALVPAGPWLQWHFDRFTLPPGAEELAHPDAGVQAFAQGPHLGMQFHPESTIEIVRGWARADRDRLAALGIGDGEALVDEGRRHAAAAAQAAFDLFDASWQRTRT
jgi:hypothetical protein